MSHEVYRDGELHVLSARCPTCIFRPGNLMSLERGRVKAMLSEAVANQSVIPCHKTIWDDERQPAVCRGYFDHPHAREVFALRLAEAMGVIVEDAP